MPHDNENVAFDTGIYGVAKYGGVMVAVETGGARFNGAQDPNRNFSDNGPGCAQRVAKESRRYTEAYFKRWNQRFPIVALHSNTPAGGISINRPSPGTLAFPAPRPRSAFNSEDTLVFIASAEPPDRALKTKHFKDTLNEAGVHVLWEIVTPARNDCSMSNYAALKGYRTYFNVEVVHGDGATQKKIVDLIRQEFAGEIWPPSRPVAGGQ